MLAISAWVYFAIVVVIGIVGLFVLGLAMVSRESDLRTDDWFKTEAVSDDDELHPEV